MRHFGGWMRSFNVVPSRRAGDEPASHAATKKEFLEWWGKADVLVEDSPANLAGAEELGIQTVLVPRPWNGKRRSLQESLDELTAFVS
jgi:FMN phosphatase YigB (HAD superfamily)